MSAEPPQPQPPSPAVSTPAGWCPDPAYPGYQRYWDGVAWQGQPAPLAPATFQPTSGIDDKTLALLCHIGQLVGGFVVPLVIYLIKKDQSPFVKHHAAEALNFAITTTIAYVVAFALVFVLVGFVLLPLLFIGHFVFLVMATIAANKGEWYRYPLNLRLVK